MKNRLLLLLVLFTQYAFAQTSGTAYIPIQRRVAGVVQYKRVLRDYAIYPATSTGTTSFTADLKSGTLPVENRVGPTWLSARITYLESKKYLQVEAQTTANVLLTFDRVDATTLVGANPDGVVLQSGIAYGYGPTKNVTDYSKQWAFGKSVDGSGGIPSVPIRLTFKNLDTQETYTHVFTPIDRASRAQLFVAANSSPPVVSSPTWLSARYTYNPTAARLDVEASGESVQLQFDRVDGVPLVGSNPDGVSLSSGIFFGSGPLSGQGSYDKQWAFGKTGAGSGGIPTVPIRLTFKRASTSETYAIVFTPATVTRQQLFTASAGATTCNYTLSTTNQSASCGGTITLSASVSGPNATGLTYTWTGGQGSGINQSGQSVVTNAPSANGAYAYLITTSKAGCENKSATATVTVTGCTPSTGETPLAGAFDYSPFPSASIPSSYTVAQENSAVKLVFNLKTGNGASNGLAGGILGIWDKSTNTNLVSNPIYRPGYCGDCGYPAFTFDLGSGLQPAIYRYPHPWAFLGSGDNIGDNPLMYGSASAASSKLLQYGRSTIGGNIADYMKVDAAQWDGATQGDGLALRLGDIIEQWTSQVGNLTKIWHQITLNRTSANGGDNTQLDPKAQEINCLYANGGLTHTVFYDGDSPYSNGSTRTINFPENGNFWQGDWNVTENWLAAIGDDGRGIGLIFPSTSVNMTHFNSLSNLPDGTAFGRSYIAWTPKMNLDKNVRLQYSLIAVTGTVAEIRAAAYAYTNWKQTPEYRFNQPGRQLWYLLNATDPGYVSSRTSWPITFKYDNGQFVSPGGAWSGANKKIYLRYRYPVYNRPNPSLLLQWRRARQADFSTDQSWFSTKYPDGSGYGDDYSKSTTLIADGQWHVAEFDMSGKTEWKGIISEFKFRCDGTSAINETIEVEWVSANASGPTN